MKIGNKVFDVEGRDKTYVVGILNITPDSFYDGGKYDNLEQAMFHTEEMINEGADMIDIGAESTRPGFVEVSAQEEIERLGPVIDAVKTRFDIPISLDTNKSDVAKAGIEQGVVMINDVWGLKKDPEMAKVISENEVACCLMHNRENQNYQNFMGDLCKEINESILIAEKAGIASDKIILDPGVGFGKNYDMNLSVIQHLENLHMFGYPLLLGASRKSVIGLTLDLPVEERLEGTLVTTVMAVMKGVSFIRVHDVRANKRAISMTEAIIER